MRSPLQQLIERCRRQQQQIPGQLEIPDTPDEQTMWATEQEALDAWREQTV